LILTTPVRAPRPRYSDGKGLGKKEDGIKTFIRVSKKSGMNGVGARAGGGCDPWWERAFDAAAAGRALPKGVPVLRTRLAAPEFSSARDDGSEDDAVAVPAATSQSMFDACGHLRGKSFEMPGKLSRVSAQESSFARSRVDRAPGDGEPKRKRRRSAAAPAAEGESSPTE
jgi:hypothetical protein